MLEILKMRFFENKSRHPGLEWPDVERRILAHPQALDNLQRMEKSGGEPDTIGFDKETGKLIYCDCSKESPLGRRSLCYDEDALKKRKKNPPAGSALSMAQEIGASLLTEELYRKLQNVGEFDLKTSSWVETPETIRKEGGAIFCERRYGTVFTFHNGADSYYSVRGFRTYILI
ncbi:MAG: DUF4256 domain-containing protein [Solobacterium sp.]|nr:DUF4256 domain-containing protein [Solobacterium sp.]